MSKQRSDAKVVLPIDNGDHDFSVEILWASSRGGNRYRLNNIPFFAYGLSFGDFVEAVPKKDDERPHFKRVLVKSGNRTVRIGSEDGRPVSDGVLQQIVELGCGYERATASYICVNIPPEADFEAVTAYLTSTGLLFEYVDPIPEVGFRA